MFGRKKKKEEAKSGVMNLDDIVDDSLEDLDEDFDDDVDEISEAMGTSDDDIAGDIASFEEEDSNDGIEECSIDETVHNEKDEEPCTVGEDDFSENETEDEFLEDEIEDYDEDEDFDEDDDFEDEEDYDEDEYDDVEILGDDAFSDEDEVSDEEKQQLKEEKRSKRKKTALKVLLGFVITIAVLYLGATAFFWKFFYYGTTINGENFAFRSVSYVQNYMKNQVDGYELALKENTGNTEIINGANIELQYEKNGELQQIMNQQNPFLWPASFFGKQEYTADVTVSYDKDKLAAQISNLNCMAEDTWTESSNAVPTYANGTYTITPEVYGTKINTEEFTKKVDEYITGFKPELVLEDEGCYADPAYTSESKEVTDAMNTMNTYIKGVVTYDTGDVVTSDMIASWLTVDDNMAVQLNQDAIKAYLKEMGSKYDTVGKEKSITTPTGKVATVSGGNYGWTVDESKEYEVLVANIQAGEPVSRELTYKTTAASRSGAEWGTTYLEVDISSQYMWYVENGAVRLETAVVTGRPTAERMTHTGVYSLYFKQRNRVLRGTKNPDGTWPYETPVKYWMAFNAGQGFHDASWQSSFGGSRYKTNGSHGCVNMPPSKAGELYGMVAQGCPVIVHN